jgi:nucleotide-binding universal stress UspA family protein
VNEPHPHGAVVVGVDYSDDSLRAASYAAWEAEYRRVPLRVVHAITPPSAMGLGFGASSVVDVLRRDAGNLAEETVARLRAAHPGLEIDHALFTSGAAAALIEESAHASLTVLGARGAGGFAKLLLGSTASQVAAHAEGPVVVVRTRSDLPVPAPGPVVVGVDGSGEASAALGFAFEAAQARGGELVAIYAWEVLRRSNLGTADSWRVEADVAQQDADRMLAEALAGWAGKFPDVAVTRRAEQADSPESLLLATAREASLLVVGSRGRGGFVGLLLGSVSRKLVAHAECSVAVVHG